MITIPILPQAGVFAENKDVARTIRLDQVIPALKKGEVTLDFAGVEGATQSFIHALISDVMRHGGSEVLEHIIFKNCNSQIKKIINIVADYMQESS